MKTSRRAFLKSTLGAAVVPSLLRSSSRAASASRSRSWFDLRSPFKEPVIIDAIELLKFGDDLIVRTRSANGIEGIVVGNSRLSNLLGILKNLVIPYFVGKDARDLEALVDDVYRHERNYKYAGLPFWNCVGHVELSILDMLGKVKEKPVAALFGDMQRTELPVYISNFDRAYTAEESIARLQKKLEGTDARAIKLKVGGRMSKNADSLPGRTEALIPLARKTFGDAMTIYVDSNGSYDADKAIEVGRMLEAHAVAFFEEPCEWQDYEATKRVADALTMDVAGGEQDSSLPQFSWMIRRRVVDLIQPDMVYNGGFIRALQVAKMAEAEGMPITPHSPTWGPSAAFKFHFASIVPNIGPFQEHRAGRAPVAWAEPDFPTRNGVVQVPTGPGWGITYDPEVWKKAEVLF